MLYNEVACVHFLTELFEQGKSYSTLNTARCALSTFLVNKAGITIGNCANIKRFMKGVFELRPPMPRYKFIWDVSIVLDYLCNFPNEEIQLNVLSYKCVMLLALCSLQRVQTLHSINVYDIRFEYDRVYIPIFKLLKNFTAKRNKLVITLKHFDSNSAICPALTLKEYIRRTVPIRGKSKQLFISFQKPHNPVSKSSLSRWISTVMEEAGIDITQFKSHSTRAAASSAAKANDIPIDEIINTAGWSNAAVFHKFYDKVVL